MTMLSLHQFAAASDHDLDEHPRILSTCTHGQMTRTTYQECSGTYTEYRTGETALIIRHGDSRYFIDALGIFEPIDDVGQLRELLTLLDCPEVRTFLGET